MKISVVFLLLNLLWRRPVVAVVMEDLPDLPQLVSLVSSDEEGVNFECGFLDKTNAVINFNPNEE